MSEMYRFPTLLGTLPRVARSRPNTTSRVWGERQWRALRSPQRVHLYAALEALREATVSEIAELTGRTRPSIYPHLQEMLRAGIISSGSRAQAGRRVATYRFLPEQMAASVDQRSGRGLAKAAAATSGALRETGRRLDRWGQLAEGHPIDLRVNPEAVTSIRVTWLDDRARTRLNRLLARVASILDSGCRARKGCRTCVLLAHFPDITAREARAALRTDESK
jgi:DNA-binding transcriptional ArsR family regulator